MIIEKTKIAKGAYPMLGEREEVGLIRALNGGTEEEIDFVWRTASRILFDARLIELAIDGQIEIRIKDRELTFYPSKASGGSSQSEPAPETDPVTRIEPF